MRYAARRIAQAVVIVVIVTFITFWMQELLPGNACDVAGGIGASEEQVAQCREDLNLDENIFVRYGLWVKDMLSGDFGTSYVNDEPVSEALATRLPRTIALFLYSQLVALAIAVPAGIWSAYKPGGWIDRMASSGAFVFLSVPVFVLAELSRYIFAIRWDWYDISGYAPLSEGLGAHFKSMWLPVLILGLVVTPIYLRLLRTDMRENLQQDYVAVAKAKGMTDRYILLRHVLRPSSLTLLTVAGLNVAQLVNGAVVIEFIFDLDGMGSYLIEKIIQREFVAVQSVVALVVVLFVVINLIVDLLYGVIDPRVRVERSTA